MTLATATAPTEVGIYADIPDAVYHADRNSLSSSGARKLLPPSCPAIFRYEQDQPPEIKTEFEFGHAAHTLVLGKGADLVDVGFDSWATKASKEARDAARAAGKTPLKSEDYAKAHAMAAAVKRNPVAAALLENGTPELSMYWDDPETGSRLRCRPDWLTHTTTGRPLCVDYKTTAKSAQPAAFGKSAADFGYHQQAPFYLDGLEANGLADAAFLFVVQSKVAPYLVSVVELDPEAIALGRDLNRAAIRLFADCMATDTWPSYGDHIHLVNIPQYAYYQSAGLLNAQ
ncbi:PD-(D/E)XK nuclease-like domain-containing protein [Williamsia sp. DF01-3]|uniref:PD-(D/E)XK nuclease-like domain-containing protein n=1 Tax=Williamsia sp. DF01-3 TaxID=2934157 RepID=UPI001FF6B074|nr:PD-(D/E)XK nuclease-like domain-containing protein [Williamsia sp. DF01-3]MCK0517903.1 PD-(D/E)XK nuclease-like domain-containing protein [Williamsia sp. DF01-3]